MFGTGVGGGKRGRWREGWGWGGGGGVTWKSRYRASSKATDGLAGEAGRQAGKARREGGRERLPVNIARQLRSFAFH